jgi:hypothetical protein
MGGLEKVVGSLPTPDAIRVPAGVAIICGDEVVQFDHLALALTDEVISSRVVVINGLVFHLVPVREKELSGD